MNAAIDLALTKQSIKLIEQKLGASAIKVSFLANLQKLWLAVVMQTVRDLSASESEARAARFYLFGGDPEFERVADLAGLDASYVRRVILTIANQQETRCSARAA